MANLSRQGLALACLLTLAACGGGSDGNYVAGAGGTSATGGTGTGTSTGTGTNTGTGDTGTTTSSTISHLEIAASSRQLASSGDSPVVISAIAKDANNNVLKNVVVQFAVDNNATIEPDDATAGGAVKTASLTPGLNNPQNRTLNVTVTAENQTQQLNVEVTGTTLQLDGPERIVMNSPATFTVKLKDSAGAGLAYQTVMFNSSNGNTVSPVDGRDFSTDAKGEMQFVLQATQSGLDTLTASALGANFSRTLDISGDDFSLSSPKAEIKVNEAETVSLVWKRNGTPQSGKTIKLSATRGILPLQVVTDTQGLVSFAITSATAGGTVITATDAESGLSTALTKEFVATIPAYLNVQTEQGMIGPEESVSIIALVHDVNDNPVKNQVVAFNLNDTVNGSLSSSRATTDSLGRATVVYTAGNATSAKDGVVINTSLPANPTITDQVKLTVGSRALRLVLGHDENLQEEDIYYKQRFGVIVTDSNGNAVANKRVDFAVVPLAYWKGTHTCDNSKWVIQSAVSCPAEDQDKDGLLDEGEDFNGNGMLEPSHAAAVTPFGLTDAEGKVSIDITYLQSQAQWSKVRLTANVVVAGTEYMESADFTLAATASDLASCEVAPPNMDSPYGVALECASPN